MQFKRNLKAGERTELKFVFGLAKNDEHIESIANKYFGHTPKFKEQQHQFEQNMQLARTDFVVNTEDEVFDQFVMVPKGDLTYKNATDLYLYPNTVVAVKVTGAEVKEWLECSANMFNQIDATSSEPQGLINWEKHRTYNFDVIDGVTYEIDVTKPTRYNGDCELQDESAERIVDLAYDDNSVVITGEEFAKNEFIVATNNYRGFGGKFAGTGSGYVVLEAPDENRQVLSDYISKQTEDFDAVSPSADNNWTLKLIENAPAALDICFETSNIETADNFIIEKQQYQMWKVETDEFGFAVYRVDLTIK